jgi:hypothetical protein
VKIPPSSSSSLSTASGVIVPLKRFSFLGRATRLCIPFCVPFYWLSSSRNPGELLPSSCKKKNSFPCSFSSKGNFPGIPFCRNYVLQKIVPFFPLLPKPNNSPACRPKKSKTCHTQQHNPQQRISVAALIGRSFYLLPSSPCRIVQLACLPLVVPSRPSCLVGCCVAQWPPSASQPVAPPLVAPSICWLSRGIAS